MINGCISATMIRSCAFSLTIEETSLQLRGQHQMCRIARDFACSTHGPQASGTPAVLSRRRIPAWSVRSGGQLGTNLFVCLISRGRSSRLYTPVATQIIRISDVKHLQLLCFSVILGYDSSC